MLPQTKEKGCEAWDQGYPFGQQSTVELQLQAHVHEYNTVARITFPTKKLPKISTTSRYRGHSAVVRHNTNFATVHSDSVKFFNVTSSPLRINYDEKFCGHEIFSIFVVGLISQKFCSRNNNHCYTSSVSASMKA